MLTKQIKDVILYIIQNVFNGECMLLFVLIPLLIAVIKGYRILNVFKVIDLYPFLSVCLTHGVFIIAAWCDIYTFVQYSDLMQYLFIITLLLPIFRRQLSVQAIVGSVLTVVGTLLNKLVINANDGHMPVRLSLSKLIGYASDSDFMGSVDSMHILMSDQTKMNFLADYIDLGTLIMSPGDVLIHSFASIIVYYTLISVCPRKEGR